MLAQLNPSPFKPLCLIVGYWYHLSVKMLLKSISMPMFFSLRLNFVWCGGLICMIIPSPLFWGFGYYVGICLGVFCGGLKAVICSPLLIWLGGCLF